MLLALTPPATSAPLTPPTPPTQSTPSARSTPPVPAGRSVLVVPAGSGVGELGGFGGSGIEVKVPGRTYRGSLALRGTTVAKRPVRVTGGVVPVSVVSGKTGRFAAEVPLWPGWRNTIKITVFTGKRLISKQYKVLQCLDKAKGRLSGRVMDILSRKPIPGAKVVYGLRTAKTDKNGRYTLTELPEGGIAVAASSPGHLGGLAVGLVTKGRGRIADLLMQPLAKPIRIGPKGGSFAGPGWRVKVPAGTVRKPTNLNLTRLVLSGAKDAFGLPVVDLSPHGLRFTRPITVAVDPGFAGLEPARAHVVGIDPDSLATIPLKSRVVGKELQFQLTTLHGLEVRFEPPPDPLNTWGGPSKFCTPFATYNDAARARQYLHDIMLPVLRIAIGETSYYLWNKYLTAGVPSPTREEITDPDALVRFDEDPATVQARRELLNNVRQRVVGGTQRPLLSAPEDPTTKQLSDFRDVQGKPLGENVEIGYGDYSFALPVNIAGGVGETHLPGQGTFLDRRDLFGDIKFIPHADAKGVLTRVDMNGYLKLALEDSVDFCPGDMGGNFVTNFTIPLSRLETTPYPGGGTWAKPVMYKLRTDDPKAITRDVTDAYHNDVDKDGVPDAQPWRDASFKLDNCPTTPNPDQADGNHNGIGDACELCPAPQLRQAAGDSCEQPPGGVGGEGGGSDGGTRPDPGEPAPGTGGSYGDPHFITFDGGAFDFQGAGDYVLAESASGDFEVQGRYVRLPGRSSTVSVNRGVAAKVGRSVIAFGDDTTSEPLDRQVATLDGKRIALSPGMRQALPGGAVLTFSAVRGAVVRWPDGTELAAGRWIADNAFLTLAQSRWGKVRGLLGDSDRNPANDLTARDGTRVTDPLNLAQMYGSFGAGWQATGKASLFRTAIPESGALPVRPDKVASVADLPAATRDDAEKACRDLGVAPGAALQQCILDVGLTGDRSYAGSAGVVANRLRGSVDLAALGGRVEDTATLPLGQNVRGSLDKAYATDVYQVDLKAGETVKVTTPGPCPGSGTFSITLVAPSGRAIDRTRGAGCGTLGVSGLRETGRYQLRVFDTGGFTGAYTLRADLGQADLLCRGDKVLPSDDELSPKVDLPFTINFKGKQFSSLWVNNNGNVTFDSALTDYTPEPFDQVRSPMIAAWWADVDTRTRGSGQVKYGSGIVEGRRAFCVDFDKVGYYNEHTDKLNSFQLYIVDRGDVAAGAFDIVFQYKQLRWESGDLSGGTAGLGGISAGVGYTNGTGDAGTFLEVDGSRRPGAFLDSAPGGLAHTSTNSTQTGVHVYPIRN